MRPHRDLPLETPVADRTVVRQRFRVRCEMLGQMVLPEKPLLTHPTLVRLDAGMSHLVATHVRPVRELHVAHVALEQLAMDAVRRRIVVFDFDFHLAGVGRMGLGDMGVQCGRIGRFEVAPNEK